MNQNLLKSFNHTCKIKARGPNDSKKTGIDLVFFGLFHPSFNGDKIRRLV